MRSLRLVALMIALAGCDLVLGLNRDTTCPYLDFEPDRDDDGDGVLNGADACPLLADQDPHDEDSDGIPDGCDPCPMLADAGADRDCDSIGAACDSDDTVPHVREFFGFGTARGIELTADAAVTDDVLRFTFPGADGYGRAMAVGPVPAPAIYEIHTTVKALGVEYCRIGFLINDPTPPVWQVVVTVYEGAAKLSMNNGAEAPISTEIGTLDVGAELSLRLSIVDSTLTARVTGVAIEPAEVTTTDASLVDLLGYGVAAYCDPASATSQFDVPYLTRTAVAP